MKVAYAPFAQAVYALVARIPAGQVVTYGHLALYAGAPANARLAGRAMREAPATLPCHRVVGSGGRLVPGWGAQRPLLEAEGVTFTPGGKVRIGKHLWRPFQ